MRDATVAFGERTWALAHGAVEPVFAAMRRWPDAASALQVAPSADGSLPEPARAFTVAAPPQNGRRQRAAGSVAVIPLRGVITPRPSFLSLLFGGGGGLLQFRQELRDALADEDVSAVLLDVDSPGGLTDLIPETAAEIRGARGVKPIVAVANTMAGSAAYWLASQADELIATPSGMAGSIGVYLAHEDYSKANEKLGVQVTYVKAGKFKTEGNADEPLSAEARKHMQELVDEPYSLFVADVAAGRGATVAEVRNGYGQGRVLPAALALDEGLVDRVESFEQVVSRMLQGGGTVRQSEPAETVEARALVAAASSQATGVPSVAQTSEPATEPAEDSPQDSPPSGEEEVPAVALPAWLAFPDPPRHL